MNSFFMLLALGLLGLGILAEALRNLRNSLHEAHEATEESRKANQKLALGIEEREGLADSLRASQMKIRTIVDSIADAVVVINARGVIIETNPAVTTVFGYTQEELQGQNISLLMKAEQAVGHANHMQHYLATGECSIMGKTLQLQARRKDGEMISIEMTVNEASVGGSVIFTGIVRDITERLQVKQAMAMARDAAVESTRLKSEFLANMSHEIRTPMNGVIGMSQLMLETRLDREQRDMMRTVRQSGEALMRVINDILDLSRIEAGKFSIYKGDFTLLSMVEGVIDLLAESASDKGLEMAFFIDRNVPANLVSDSVRLRQILLNLLGNAIKFTEKGYVTLHISVAETQQNFLQLRFDIRDSGYGIDAEDLPKLFIAFSQLDGSSTRRHGGTGLGLAISKQLTHLLGGEMGVESKPGVGSNFWFTVEAEAHGKTEPVQAPAGFKVLMLGCNPVVNQGYAQQMRQWGITPVMADHLHDLLLALETGTAPNLVMVDADLIYQPRDQQLQGMQAVVSAVREHTPAPVIFYGSSKQMQPMREVRLGQSVHLWNKPLRHSLIFKQLERLRLLMPKPALVPEQNATVSTSTETSPAPAKASTQFGRLSVAERQGVRLLLVEDHLVNQKVALMMLKRLGYGQTDCAVNGQDAVRMVQEQDYDAVLMDCQMPVMDGYEATRQIRKLEDAKFRELPIMALTAHAMKGDDDKCYAAGMDDYMTKPVQPEALQDHIDKWLRAKLNHQLMEL